MRRHDAINANSYQSLKTHPLPLLMRFICIRLPCHPHPASVTMSDALLPIYRGPLAGLTPPQVSSEAPPDALPARRLLETAFLESLLSRFAQAYPGGDRRAVVSLWSRWHFATLVGHGLTTNLLMDRDLPLSLDELHLYLSPSSHTSNLCLIHEGVPLTREEPFSRFATLIDGHLIPLIARLAEVSGLARRVLWSNAGTYFDHYLGVIETHPLARPGIGSSARQLLDSPRCPKGERNPLYQPVKCIEDYRGATRQVRRLCCLRYRIDGLGYCGNCPMDDNG